jgi:hypothetical protein
MRIGVFLVVSGLAALSFGAAFPVRAEAPRQFVEVRDGHFHVGQKRLKLWGSQTGTLGETPAAIDTEVEHFRKLGFNLYRNISVGSAYPMDYKRGDGSTMDLQDYSFAAMAKSGGYNWLDLMNNVVISSADVDVIDDPLVSREDWLKAMEGKKVRPSALQTAWDLRTQTVYLKHIDRVMNHVNQHTGLRYADDPSIAMFELVNEQWWTPHMLAGGELAALHPAIVRPLLARWNEWLQKRYADDNTLRTAWGGDLLPGESLRGSSILLQPLSGSAAMPEMAAVLGINIDLSKNQSIAQSKNPARSSDVYRFLIGLHIDFKTKATQRLRSHGAAGSGAAAIPVLRDTGASFSLQSAYEHSFGSGYPFGSYLGLIDTDRKNPTFPWQMGLSAPPSLGSWMSPNKIENVPGIIYETMTFQPGKYRADYPLRIAAFAAIADLDVVDWHYYNSHAFGPKAKPLQMPYEAHYWQAVVFGGDEVMLASMKLASTIFIHGDLAPPAEPTILVVGKDVLFNADAYDHGGLYNSMQATAMQFGLRLRFDPSAPKSHFIGRNQATYDDVCRPTPEITYRWKEGLLIIESPRVRLIAGFVPEAHAFERGERLEGISLGIPEGTPYVREGERYVCFAMCTQDEKPLGESGDVVAMAVSTSWNTGFKFDVDKYDAAMKATKHGPISAARSLEQGTLPVLVTRAGWTLNAPWLAGMTAERHDFSLETYRTDRLEKPSLTITADEPLFFVNLKKK